jgi:hypothetical protein
MCLGWDRRKQARNCSSLVREDPTITQGGAVRACAYVKTQSSRPDLVRVSCGVDRAERASRARRPSFAPDGSRRRVPLPRGSKSDGVNALDGRHFRPTYDQSVFF